MEHTVDQDMLDISEEIERLNENNIYDYDAHIKLISSLRQAGDLDKVRQARFRLNSLLILKLSDWLQWIEDEISLLSGNTDVKELFELALKDYPASVELWLKYLNFCKENPTIVDNFSKEVSRACAFAAWNLQDGHEIIHLQSSSNHSSIPFVTNSNNPSPFESFEEQFPRGIEKYIEAVKSCKNLSSSDKLTLCRVIFERAIEVDPLKLQLWEDYIKFLRSEMNVSSIILGVCRRATRLHPLNPNSWALLMEHLELFNLINDLEEIWTNFIPKTLFKMSHESFMTLQMAFLDYLRRQLKHEQLISSFQEAICFEETHFGIDPQGRLARYFAQNLLNLGEIDKLRNIWQNLLKLHAKEAGFWLEFIQIERSLLYKKGDNDFGHIINGFKRASAAVTDYPETIFYEWLQFERQHSSSLQSLLDARERIEKQRKILKEREEQRQLKEVNSRKRPRTSEHEVKKSEDLKLPAQVIKSFNPDSTLFVNNLPFTFSEEDINKHFNGLISEISDDNNAPNRSVKSIRMHMNSSGNTFKGHATIEFDSSETAKLILETFNRRSADESGRPVFLAKYVSPLEKKAAPSGTKMESDIKTLYVSNIPFKETVQIEDFFKSLNGIQQIRHVPGKQFAFIEFESEKLAEEALKQITQIDKNVKAAFSKPPTTTHASISTPTSKMTLLKPRSISIKK